MAVGDLNGINGPDLAVANIDSDDVSVLLNQGNGTFAVAVNYDAGDGPFSVAIGDLDGVGGPDLAVANLSSDDVSVLLNLCVVPGSCTGDLDGDGAVNVVDLLLLLGDFGTCDGSPADIDGDGCVTVLDLLVLLGNFGPCPGSGCPWDVNGDGVVDQTDLQQVLDSLPIHIRILGENHWRTAEARSLLGEALTGLERYEEAETHLLDGHAGLDASLPGGRRTQKLPSSIDRLVRLYDAWGKPEKAAEWRAKLPTEQEAVASDPPADEKQEE